MGVFSAQNQRNTEKQDSSTENYEHINYRTAGVNLRRREKAKNHGNNRTKNSNTTDYDFSEFTTRNTETAMFLRLSVTQSDKCKIIINTSIR